MSNGSMSDFLTGLHHNPHPPKRKPTQKEVTRELFRIIGVALGCIEDTKPMTQSDYALVK